MRLRGHHLFCAALFSGHGYNASFTAKMTAAVKAMRAGEGLELLIGPDGLCASCPNRRENGGCSLGTEDVTSRDEAALRVLRFFPGEQTSWPQVKRRLSRLTEKEFRSVCGHCRWQKAGLCSLALLRERTK